MKRFRRLLAMAFVLVGIAEMSGVSRADFAIDTGNNPQIDENVLLNNDSTGNTVFGTTNQTGLSVGFTSAAQVLLAPSGGQARIEANDGSNLEGLDSIFIVDGSYTSLIFNMFNGDGATTTITVDGFDAMNNAETLSQNFVLGNGSNFFTITAINGERITSVSFTTTGGGFADLRQVRIGGATAVPEPASLAMLGLGIPGTLTLLRRRKKASV